MGVYWLPWMISGSIRVSQKLFSLKFQLVPDFKEIQTGLFLLPIEQEQLYMAQIRN